MKTVIRENVWLKREIPEIPGFSMDFGWGNGYTLIPEGHRFYGKHYDDINQYISVHCGLTYSKLMTKEDVEFWQLDEEDIGKWCVGFDTAHFEDTLQNWPKERVQAEADRLARQLEKYGY